MVGPTPPNIERLDALAPSPAGDLRVADRPSVFEEEEMPMADFAGRNVFRAECQVALKNFERALFFFEIVRATPTYELLGLPHGLHVLSCR